MKMKVIIFATTLLLGFTGIVESGNHTRELEIINELLGKYDNRIRAVGEGTDNDGTIVHINMYVRSIQNIDDVNMNYKTQLTFRMQWMDKRLAYDQLDSDKAFTYLTIPGFQHKIWLPDIFFSNEIDGHLHEILMPNVYTRIFRDGTVLFSIRISLTLSCPMIMKLFPFDHQTCSLRMASYGYTTRDIIFKWKKDDPVQVTPDLHLRKFALESFTTDYCDSHTNTGVYSCLRLDFTFKREFRHYLVKMFIPAFMLVIVSYLALWIGDTGVTVSFVTFLVMTLSSIVTEGSKPVVSYATALDMWTGWCLTFSFLSFLICVIAKFLGSRDKPPARDSEMEEIELRPLFDLRKLNLAQNYAGMPVWEKILVVSRILYPILFVIFIIAYGVLYIRGAGHHDGVTQEYQEDDENQPGKVTRVSLPLF